MTELSRLEIIYGYMHGNKWGNGLFIFELFMLELFI